MTYLSALHSKLNFTLYALRSTLKLWNSGTLELWNSGTLELWNPGTLELWNPGTLELLTVYSMFFASA